MTLRRLCQSLSQPVLLMNNNYEEALAKTGVLSFTPGGNSMWPIIKNREDTVLIAKPEKRLKRFDVAFYRRKSGQAVLHRVLKVNEKTYDMCGDSQLFIEKGVPDEAVFGIMTGYYHNGKFIDCKKSKTYRAKVLLWCSSLFVRRVFLKILSMLHIE